MLSTTTVSCGIPPVRYDPSAHNDDVQSLQVTDLSSRTFVKVLEDLKQSASTFRRHKTKLVRMHQLTDVKRRPYQKIKSPSTIISKVNKYCRMSPFNLVFSIYQYSRPTRLTLELISWISAASSGWSRTVQSRCHGSARGLQHQLQAHFGHGGKSHEISNRPI
jgi:hypothetical protein